MGIALARKMIPSPRQFVLAGSLIVACLTLGQVGVSNAVGSEPTAAASPSDDSAVLKSILADWRARQQRITSLHVKWDSRWRPSRDQNSSSAWCQREFWVDDRGRFRLNDSAEQGSGLKATGFHQPLRDRCIAGAQWSFNGVMGRMLECNPNCGLVSKNCDHISSSPDSIRTLLLALCPLFPLERRTFGLYLPLEKSRVTSRNAIVGKTHCIKLRADWGSFADKYWVDPARDHVIVAWERSIERQTDGPTGTGIMVFVNIDYRHDKQYGWIPVGWKYTNYLPPPVSTVEDTITSVAINESIADRTFTLEFPAGTTVSDWSTRERYTVTKDGSKTNLAKYDSLGSLVVGESLEETVNFVIRPQPLKDAMKFIADRCGFSVRIDADAIRKGLIDPSLEVRSTTKGITMKMLLNRLLEQSPKPLTYKLKHGALIIIPASRPK